MSALFYICLVLTKVSLATGTYKNDQESLFTHFGKTTAVFKDKPVSIAEIEREYTEIMHMNCQGERKKREAFINKQMELGLIGWSTVYQAKPSGTLLHNIEFDHIPPGSAFPEGLNEDLFKNQAPTLAISNFDHRSALWKQCSTTGGDAAIMAKYKEFVQAGNHFCAIFANIFCIKDIEKMVAKIERISEKSAFERYKDGLKSLINLHYQFGRENNLVMKFQDKVSSAYCEINAKPPTDAATGCKAGDLVKEEPYWYCKNVGKSFDKCKGFERNLKKKEFDMLIEWMDGAKSDDKLLSECGLDSNKWKTLFPKIDWDYDSGKDTNPDGSDGTCVSYQRKWMKDDNAMEVEDEKEEAEDDAKKEDEKMDTSK